MNEHDTDTYRGLPSLNRLEDDLERSERHLNKGWASRHMRLVGSAGVALALGLGFSPVGPAFGDGESGEKGAVRTLDVATVKIDDAAAQRLRAYSLEGEPLSATVGRPAGDSQMARPTVEEPLSRAETKRLEAEVSGRAIEALPVRRSGAEGLLTRQQPLTVELADLDPARPMFSVTPLSPQSRKSLLRRFRAQQG